MKKQLPERSNLEQLKAQAKDLLNEVRAGQAAALDRIGNEARETFALHDAQRILAREYGFESWAKLKAQVEARSLEEAKRAFHAAFDADDVPEIRRLLQQFSPRGRYSIL